MFRRRKEPLSYPYYIQVWIGGGHPRVGQRIGVQTHSDCIRGEIVTILQENGITDYIMTGNEFLHISFKNQEDLNLFKVIGKIWHGPIYSTTVIPGSSPVVTWQYIG